MIQSRPTVELIESEWWNHNALLIYSTLNYHSVAPDRAVEAVVAITVAPAAVQGGDTRVHALAIATADAEGSKLMIMMHKSIGHERWLMLLVKV